MHQNNRFRLELHHTPRWGSLQRSPRSSSWNEGYLLIREGDGEGRGRGKREGKAGGGSSSVEA